MRSRPFGLDGGLGVTYAEVAKLADAQDLKS